MLRYRVALMIWLFMLLGAARNGAIDAPEWRLLWAVLVLACAYVAATTVNDVVDRDIDRVNHPNDPGRPLVAGTATESQLWAVHGTAAVLALATAVPLGPPAILIVVLSLLIGWVYSLPPLVLSHRAYLAPGALAIAYVVLPYALGVHVAPGSWTADDAPFVAALVLLFAARITLKDFRDREGDARYGKPTLLLRFGKTVTCAVSLLLLVGGNVLLVAALRPPWTVVFVLEAVVAGIVSRLVVLWTSTDLRAEQVAIGLGARLGNGLLILVLGWLALSAHGAPMPDRVVFVVTAALIFGGTFAVLATRPDRAVLGYKG